MDKHMKRRGEVKEIRQLCSLDKPDSYCFLLQTLEKSQIQDLKRWFS